MKHTEGKLHLHDMETATIVGVDHLAVADCNAIIRKEEVNIANAAEICRRWNCYEELVKALSNLVSATYGNEIPSALRDAEAALAHAKEGK